jgi:hypothetical protein
MMEAASVPILVAKKNARRGIRLYDTSQIKMLKKMGEAS